MKLPIKSFALMFTLAISVLGCAIDGKRTSGHHLYSFKDGNRYGYETVDENHVPGPAEVFHYLGIKNSTLQLMQRMPDQGSVLRVIECTIPCDHYKFMRFDDGALTLKEWQIIVEKSAVHAAILDATYGNLEEIFTVKQGGKDHHLWFDEEDGIILTPASKWP